MSIEKNYVLGPDYCCGRCPEVVSGGVDCTCRGNKRCPKYRPLRARLQDKVRIRAITRAIRGRGQRVARCSDTRHIPSVLTGRGFWCSISLSAGDTTGRSHNEGASEGVD